MLTLELVNNGEVDVLTTMSSIHSMSSTFTKFENKLKENNGKEQKNKKMNNLGP
jgi:hypothetical protein